MFVSELNGCGFKSSCSQLNFRFRACFEQGVLWHSSNYRVWSLSGTCAWHDKNKQLIYNVEKKHYRSCKDLNIYEITFKTVFKSFKSRGSNFRILYGCCKVQKLLVDNCLLFKHIISEIETYTRNLSKFLLPLLEPINANMNTVKDSFEFA